jgi:prolipoprotein diacylglyceryltransferase
MPVCELQDMQEEGESGEEQEELRAVVLVVLTANATLLKSPSSSIVFLCSCGAVRCGAEGTRKGDLQLKLVAVELRWCGGGKLVWTSRCLAGGN